MHTKTNVETSSLGTVIPDGTVKIRTPSRGIGLTGVNVNWYEAEVPLMLVTDVIEAEAPEVVAKIELTTRPGEIGGLMLISTLA